VRRQGHKRSRQPWRAVGTGADEPDPALVVPAFSIYLSAKKL
jgi:hypothetical protein